MDAVPSLHHKQRRVDFTRSVVHRHNQIARFCARHPLVPAGVLVQHHPRHRTARTLAAVRAPHARQFQQPAPLQQRLGPRAAPPEAALNQVLVEVLGREARELVPVQALDLVRLRVRNPVRRHSPKPAIPKPRRTLVRNRPHQRRNVRLLTPSSSAASAWLSLPLP